MYNRFMNSMTLVMRRLAYMVHALAHFTSISTETDSPNAPRNNYVTHHRYGGFGNQLAWLEADLKAAHANRYKVPWLIVGMHRPIYTSRSCDANGNPTNDYDARIEQQAFEDLFIKYEVDFVIEAHVHAYERTYPIAKARAFKEGGLKG
ncbi:hypothetical protein PsorP6_019017 [Peronosclerospora sorghi]|nr:hypothetical protein PsorP6_019017 [Peronosclerospora sorghi]